MGDGSGRRSALLLLVCLGGASPAAAVDVPVGRWRLEAAGSLEFLDVERVEKTSPRQNPEGRIRLRLGAEVASHLRIETAWTGIAGGTPRNPSGAGVFDLNRTRQDISPSLEAEEAYVEDVRPSFEVRVGLQKFAWGKLDELQPNDLLNPRKFYDPLLDDEIDRKVGVPAVAGTVALPVPETGAAPTDLRLTAVWLPLVVPYHFPDIDERWFPPVARAPAKSRIAGPGGIELAVANSERFRNAAVPARTLANGGGALRLAGLFHGADFSLYYYDGYDTAPAFDARATGFVRLDPASPQGVDLRSAIDVFPIFRRIRSIGTDLAYELFGFAFRGEAAYILGRLYPHTIRRIVAEEQFGAPDPAVLASGRRQAVPIRLGRIDSRLNAFEWGLGADRTVADTFVLLQVNQTALVRDDPGLLISEHETRFELHLRRTLYADRVTAELTGLYGPQGVYGLAHPRVTWQIDDHSDVRVGYVLIEGHESSLIGQYKHDDEGYVRWRLRF